MTMVLPLQDDLQPGVGRGLCPGRCSPAESSWTSLSVKQHRQQIVLFDGGDQLVECQVCSNLSLMMC